MLAEDSVPAAVSADPVQIVADRVAAAVDTAAVAPRNIDVVAVLVAAAVVDTAGTAGIAADLEPEHTDRRTARDRDRLCVDPVGVAVARAVAVAVAAADSLGAVPADTVVDRSTAAVVVRTAVAIGGRRVVVRRVADRSRVVPRKLRLYHPGLHKYCDPLRGGPT